MPTVPADPADDGRPWRVRWTHTGPARVCDVPRDRVHRDVHVDEDLHDDAQPDARSLFIVAARDAVHAEYGDGDYRVEVFDRFGRQLSAFDWLIADGMAVWPIG